MTTISRFCSERSAGATATLRACVMGYIGGGDWGLSIFPANGYGDSTMPRIVLPPTYVGFFLNT